MKHTKITSNRSFMNELGLLACAFEGNSRFALGDALALQTQMSLGDQSLLTPAIRELFNGLLGLMQGHQPRRTCVKYLQEICYLTHLILTPAELKQSYIATVRSQEYIRPRLFPDEPESLSFLGR